MGQHENKNFCTPTETIIRAHRHSRNGREFIPVTFRIEASILEFTENYRNYMPRK